MVLPGQCIWWEVHQHQKNRRGGGDQGGGWGADAFMLLVLNKVDFITYIWKSLMVCFVSFSSEADGNHLWMATSRMPFSVLSTYSLTTSSVWLGENDAWEGHWTKNTDCVIWALLSLLHSHNSFGLSFLLCQSVFPQTLSCGTWLWNMREGGRAQPLKEWHGLRTWHNLIRTK